MECVAGWYVVQVFLRFSKGEGMGTDRYTFGLFLEWTGEQERQPPSPSYLRILHLGKILQDESTLACP